GFERIGKFLVGVRLGVLSLGNQPEVKTGMVRIMVSRGEIAELFQVDHGSLQIALGQLGETSGVVGRGVFRVKIKGLGAVGNSAVEIVFLNFDQRPVVIGD